MLGEVTVTSNIKLIPANETILDAVDIKVLPGYYSNSSKMGIQKLTFISFDEDKFIF